MIVSTENDLAYYERRAREEARAVAASNKPKVAAAHRLLAIEYEAHAREHRARQPHQPGLTVAST